MRIVVIGYVVRGPLGAMVWNNLQYLMGLRELGHDVYFLEDSEDYPACYDPLQDATTADATYGLRFAEETFKAIGFDERWAYHDAHQSRWRGPCADRALAVCRSADLLVNVCGVNPLRPWLEAIPRKALIDQDPVFTQVKNLTDSARAEYARRHDAWFTFAENLGTDRATVPDDGISWQPTRQPVVLNALSPAEPPPHAPFTTVMNWASYDPVRYRGVTYGVKAQSFLPYIELPQRTTERIELAIGGPAPRELLTEKGWRLRDAREPTVSVFRYLEYVRASKAEFGIAKEAYVTSRSGWFSERSAAYLATGRPVVVQDTGFTDWLSAGEGVVAFRTLDEAVTGIEAVAADYERHCRCAREMVEAYFDARRVLADLLERAMKRDTGSRKFQE
jgi:hypothetical protein